MATRWRESVVGPARKGFLPSSPYHVSPDRSYPVLWAMDGAMAFSLTAGVVNLYTLGGRIPEIIVMGVGYPSEEGMAGLGKRTFDRFPPGSVVSDEGPASDYMQEELGFDFEAVAPLLKDDRFLDFLVDQLRSSLSDKYRMADDHTLWGHSAGGAFAGYALLARPGAFDRFIIGKRYERPDERVGGGLRGGPRRPLIVSRSSKKEF